MSWIRWIGALALAGVAGCGSAESRYKLVPVTGTVTINGNPLGNAQVNFAPLDGNAFNTPGVDKTGPSGNYKLMFKGRAGVAPGKYKITITPPDPAADGDVSDAFKGDPAMARFAAEAKRLVRSKKKAEPTTKNEFETEVPEEGGVIDFDVKIAAPAPEKEKAK